ncbi:MAG: T9SS type A sorting domain-containing protein, partial [Bacteroidales bacterium]|nr:T9SS type A sorting domain-containing protein [Bacteroidales bacterium]
TLSVKGLNEDATIILTDQQGKVISTTKLANGSEIAEIETTTLASGVYYVRIQTANAVRTEKLIKK